VTALVTGLVLLGHVAIVAGLGARVVMRARPVGVTLGWLLLIVGAPLVGAVVYLAVGEARIGERRRRALAGLMPRLQEWVRELPRDAAVDWSALGPEAEPLHRLAVATVRIPAVSGNAIEILDDAETILRAIIAEVERARSSVHLEFYIWERGGTADDVVAAVIDAAGRGVRCRVLLDSLGSASFLKGPEAARLRAAGVEVVGALPAGLVHASFSRVDLRLHRKIVVIDGEVAFTGSLNLVDPRYFKQDAGVGQWVDVMVRVRGPAVEPLAATFLVDWLVETGQRPRDVDASALVKPTPAAGTANVQVVPSGPALAPDAIHKLLLTTMYAARRELVLTTPYFVPDEAVVTALESAAQRGVAVTLIVPARVDSLLARLASRASFDGLLAAGVRIAKFEGGLLHSKTITVDGEISVCGSVNLDPRSLWLNFEISLFAYDAAFTGALRELQQRYVARSRLLDLAAWRQRPLAVRFVENVFRLAGPLL